MQNDKSVHIIITSQSNSPIISANVFAKVVLLGKYDKKNDQTFLSVKERKITIKIGSLRIHFSNLFNGNKQLSEYSYLKTISHLFLHLVQFSTIFHFTGDSTNVFINENWRDILQEIGPLIEDTIGEVMMQIIKGLLDLYSLEDLIPN